MTRLQFLGKNIKKYRLQNNYSQEFLAEKCNLSREYISRIENGNRSNKENTNQESSGNEKLRNVNRNYGGEFHQQDTGDAGENIRQ